MTTMEQRRNQNTVQQQDDEETQHGPFPVEQLQVRFLQKFTFSEHNLPQIYLGTLVLCTVEGVAYTPRKDLLQIKGISDAKVTKSLKQASSKLVPLGFTSAASSMPRDRRSFRLHLDPGSSNKVLEEELKPDPSLSCMVSSALGRLSCAIHCCNLPTSHGSRRWRGKAMYIDAEGTFRPQRLLQIADRAYNTDHQSSFCFEAASMMVETRCVEFALMIVDRATALYRTDFSGRESFRLDKCILQKFLRSLQKLAEIVCVAVVITNK
ncbi:hypothetical protein HID58_095767 [Brassica napus]|uniref:Rad51-like C-terminal domain-containing protein n=1 Tax=Brassica napus TaxID=3708 RepID=A0ABQ7X2F8_BRANA|nr:hypothetical protein HID58_095767 [Brassica napus]